MATNDTLFPPIRDLEDQPFMRTVSGFEELRASNIATNQEVFLAILNEMPALAGVSDEAKQHLALRYATHGERELERGFQGGIETEREAAEARARDDWWFKFHAVGN